MKWSEVKERKYAEISSALQRTVTYEPNNFETWAKAIEVVGDLAEPLVKDGTLADYQVICDEETNTQEVKDMHMFVLQFGWRVEDGDPWTFCEFTVGPNGTEACDSSCKVDEEI